MPSHDHLWDEEEVGRYLNVSPFTVRSWRQQGKIGYTQIGGVFRYIPEEIKEFAKRGRKAPRCPDCGNNGACSGEILLPNQVNPVEPAFFSDLKAAL